MSHLPRHALRAALALLVAATSLALAGPGAARPFFLPTSFWNQALPANAPLAPNSRAMVARLTRVVNSEVDAKNGPWINSTGDGVTIINVPARQPLVRVKLDHSPDAALTAAWSAVPLPRWVRPPSGDGDVAVWQPSRDRMWEFFELNHRADGWHAEWGGAMRNVSSNPGVYGPTAWPGAKNWWGVTASSLPIVGGVMTNEDLASGTINHALAIIVPEVRAGMFAAPAKRCDGASYASDSLPEGAHLRLDPSLDLAALDLPPLTRMIAQAAQKYGIFVRDRSPIVAFIAQNPLSPPSDVLHRLYDGDYPYRLLARFPWSRLQVLRMDLHRTAC